MDRRIGVAALPAQVERALRQLATQRGLEIVGLDELAALDARDEPTQASAGVSSWLAGSASAAREARRHEASTHVVSCSPIVILSAASERGAAFRAGAHARVSPAGDAATTAARLLREGLDAADDYTNSLVGGSDAMQALRAELRLAAPTPSTVLLLGETGTGKNIAARALHALARSKRDDPAAAAPFETVDCAGLAPTLIESELFGHERGAFTGAVGRHTGRLERAGSGTLFLDEIGELDANVQTRLLRALEDREFERVGGRAPRPLRARIVAATHRDLWADAAAGRFRRDLLYRLDVVRIRVPSLASRAADLPALVDFLLARAARRLGSNGPLAHPELVERLARHDWPGNVRELANRLEAALARSDTNIVTPAHLAPLHPDAEVREGTPLSGAPSAGPLRVEGEHVELASLLVECGGNVARVARRLGKPRSTVRYRIARLGLTHLLPND